MSNSPKHIRPRQKELLGPYLEYAQEGMISLKM